MRHDLAETCLRIAVKSGDWLALAKCVKTCEVRHEDWRNCFVFWIGSRIQTLKIILLSLMTIGVLPWIWGLELPQRNQIEKLRPLVAQLAATGGSGKSTARVSTGRFEAFHSPQLAQPPEQKQDDQTAKVEPTPQKKEKQTAHERKNSKETTVKTVEANIPVATASTRETSTNDQVGQGDRAETDPAKKEDDGFSGLNGSGKDWGVQRTALHERAPMHFREIDTKESKVWVSETEVTQRQWVALMGLDLSVISGHWDQAVDGVSWCKSLEYANELSRHEKRKPVYRFKGKCEMGGQVSLDHKADGYRLLIESEWLMLAKHAPEERLISNSNNRGISSVYVGQEPQQNGLYGLQGNAAEWVWAADTTTHRGSRSAAVVRHCSGESNCRQSLEPAERPSGTGLRLARGPIIPNGSDI